MLMQEHVETLPTVVPPGTLETIAICIPMTTRNLKNVFKWTDLALVNALLPSIAETAERGFVYWVYVGYDEDDAFLDNDERMAELHAWFETNVARTLRSKDIGIELRVRKFRNILHQPGPAFNFLTKMAFYDNATWIYRINDDVVMKSPWASSLTTQIKSYGKPFGVAGPWCNEGSKGVLQQDMTHRTHLEIFEQYYPVELTSWWMDEWLTKVYGRRRTKRLWNVLVLHRMVHGSRYEVDHSSYRFLEALVRSGHARILAYMRDKLFPIDAIERFENDLTAFGVFRGLRLR